LIKYKDLNNKTHIKKRYKFKLVAVATQAENETLYTAKEFSYLTFKLE
jgi:hypothetical protein